MQSVVDHILKRDATMETDRSNFLDTLQEITEFVTPNRGDFTVRRAKADRLDRRVFDTTAIHAAEMLASALHSGLTNPSTKWFTLAPSDITLSEIEGLNEWIERRVRAMFAVLNSPSTGFYQHNHEFLLDIVTYGTACMYIEEDEQNVARFRNLHLAEIKIQENERGEVDTVLRKFKYTARQAVKAWGDNCPEKLKKDAVDKPDEEYQFIHMVMPRDDYERIGGDTADFPVNQKFIGVYVCVEDKKQLEVSGYFELPYVVARWKKLVGEVYGRSPAWNALSDIRMVNVMSETIIRAAQKQVDPPLLMADDGVVMPLKTHPSGVNIGGVNDEGRELVKPLVTGGNLAIGEEMLQQRRDMIMKAFFVDQFAPSEGTPASATERIQIEQTGLRLTGPHLNRLQVEYLTRVLRRLFKILDRRNGSVDQPPIEAREAGFRVDYISPLSNNQRRPELQALNLAVQATAPLIELNPQLITDNVDSDGIFRDNLEIAGVPRNRLISPDKRDRMRKEREAEQQRQAQLQQAQSLAETAGNLQRSGIPVVE